MTSTLFPAAPGTVLLIPELNRDGVFSAEEHPIVGWQLTDKHFASPIFPGFTPANVNRAAGIEHPSGPVSLPAASLTFTDRTEWEAYAERICQHDRDALEDEPQPAEAHYVEARLESPDDDTREYGKTADASRSRRTAAEIAEDEAYLKAVEDTGVTIRAANSRFKKLGSRAKVLADLRGEDQTEAAAEDAPEETEAKSYGDDDDLLG